MDRKRIVLIGIMVFLVIFIADITYILAFKINAFDRDLYSKKFEKYNVYGEFPLHDVDRINSEILDYLQDRRDDFDDVLFKKKEVDHFRDVKHLIQKLDVYFYFAVIFSVFLFFSLFFLDKNRFVKNLARILFFSGVLGVLFGIVVLLLVAFDFSGFFSFFHKVAFPQGGWLFSASDNIIKLYPSGFFYDMAKRIFLDSLLYANILILVGVLIFVKND